MTCEDFHDSLESITKRSKHMKVGDDLMATGSELYALNKHITECKCCYLFVFMIQLEVMITEPETFQRCQETFDKFIAPKIAKTLVSDPEVQ